MREYEELLDFVNEIRRENVIIKHSTYQSDAGLEMVDAKVFLGALRTIGDKSRKLLKFIANQRPVTVSYIPASDCHLNRKVLTNPFTKIASNVVYQPVGFEGSISEFLNLLEDNQKDMINVQKALTDANVIFSSYMSKPDELSKIDIKRVPQLDKVDNLPEEFRRFFTGADGVDRAELDSLYASFADFGTCSSMVDSITKKFQDIKLKDVKRAVNDLYDTIDHLTKRLEKDNINISKPVAASIGNLIYNLADWVAVYSLYISKLVAVSKSHKATANKLNGFF